MRLRLFVVLAIAGAFLGGVGLLCSELWAVLVGTVLVGLFLVLALVAYVMNTDHLPPQSTNI